MSLKGTWRLGVWTSLLVLVGCGQLQTSPQTGLATSLTLPASVVTGSYSHPWGTRAFRLYLPPRAVGAEPPLLVLLHGCTQTAQDFALGTSMDSVAQVLGFAVLYPEQSTLANLNRCWNWFDEINQSRGSGEAAILADMAWDLARRWSLERKGMGIAGLSAGGAMAVILAATYPDRFAFLGVVAGLEYKAATTLYGALAAMALGGPDPELQGRAVCQSWGRAYRLPLLVFHGDQDTVVNPVNGEQVYLHWLYAHQACGTLSSWGEQKAQVQEGGRTSSVRTASDGSGVVAEFWLVQGMAHRWPGGDPAGSYTDPQGPQASWRIAERWLSVRR